MKGKDIPSRLKELGIKAYQKAKDEILEAKSSVEGTILEENLRHRFNLENPYKFAVMSESKPLSTIKELTAKHAKRYDEDDLFVFFGKPSDNDFLDGNILRDLSNNAEYKIRQVLEVETSVEYKGKTHEVAATAVVCDMM
ncbi:MAG: hypothetical protein PHP32_00985 [Candidatus Izemoplasmatales bacterium]|nr:hypothetical protein [Candidatus Izemoplasmatales bacterium]